MERLVDVNDKNNFVSIFRSGILTLDELMKSNMVYHHALSNESIDKPIEEICFTGFRTFVKLKLLGLHQCTISYDKYIHLYVKGSGKASSLYRLCYLAQHKDDNFLKLGEARDYKGDNYSALYYELLKSLKHRKIIINNSNNEYLIPLSRIDDFIECVNNLVIDFNENRIKYMCVVADKDFAKVVYDEIKKDYNYFHKIYWIRNHE